MSEPKTAVARSEGVRNRGSDRWHAGLANATRSIRRGADYPDMNLRDFGEPQHAIVVEICFLDLAVHNIDLFVQTLAYSVDDTANHLSIDVCRLDRRSGVYGAPDVQNTDFSGLVGYTNLSDLGAMRTQRIRVRDSERRSFWSTLPPRHFRDSLENPLCPWFVVEKPQPYLKWIGAGRGSDLIEHAFNTELRVTRTDGSPKADVDASLGARTHPGGWEHRN